VARFADLNVAEIRAVSDGYFGVVDMEILAGRGVEPSDRADTEPVVVVNRAMADRFWDGGDALDGHLSISGDEGPWLRVVGIVENVHHFGLDREPRPEMYLPLAQEAWPTVNLVARVQGDPSAFASVLRAATAEVDPALPVANIRPLQSLVDRASAPWRFQAVLVAVFAAVAGLLAATGVYGLLDYVVKERAAELSIRSALGARAADLRWLVGGDAASLTGLGIVLGLLAGFLVTRIIQGMLFGVNALDPMSYVAAAALLGVVSVVATWLPAARAGRVDPAGVLRST
jgi:hypothetical protein